MTSGQENLLAFGLIAVAVAAAWGWFSDKSRKLKEDKFNAELREKLESDRKALEQTARARTEELSRRAEYLDSLRTSFDRGFLNGRTWLAHFLAEADKAVDDTIAAQLQDKKRPAYKAAEEVAQARTERRAFKERAKFLEYQLRSYKEYFPFLDEYEELILDEAVPLSTTGENMEALEEADPVLKFVPKEEYERLPSAERNQIALQRYLNGGLSPVAIGRLYERFVGHLYEKDGWAVEYHGIVKGLEDLGRDLICTRGDEVHVVQVKCWSKEKLIHEKHIFQLFGTTQLFLMASAKGDLFTPKVTPRFVTTTNLSPVAKQAAEWLKIDIQESLALDKTFPMIKCNINQSTEARIYHLPFDQQYDRTKIVPRLGERYVATAAQAEKLGFRRAFRFSGAR
jgi:Restriction endonuclease